MALKSIDQVLQPDSRFDAMCIVEPNGTRPFLLADLHEAVASISLNRDVPIEVQDAFDRARSVMIYAYFDYDLFVLGEIQALGTFELALKIRLDGHKNASKGTLRNLVSRARKNGTLPPFKPELSPMNCPIEFLIYIRNSLSHGNTDIHLPGDAIKLVSSCARWINFMFPVPS